MENEPSPTCDVHICEQCCAEFSSITELYQHQKDCTRDQLVLIVSQNESLDSPPSVNSPFFNTEEHLDGVTQNDGTEDLDGTLLEVDESLDVSENSSQKSHENSDCADGFSSTHPASLPQESTLLELCKLSAINSNVFIENLENTKVAVAQFSQENRFNSNSTKVDSGLIEQLLSLQQQQVQQLTLIKEIREQILLLASQNSNEGLSETSQLIKLSSRLSEQLTAATGLAENLAADAKQPTQVASQNNQDSSNCEKDNKSLPLKIDNQSLHDNKVKNNTPSDSPTSNGILSKLGQPHKPNGFNLSANSLPSIGAIVEDLNALTALAQHRKARPILPEHKRPPEDCIFKHKCRFCAKVFGSDSALQIHLRSHTGERPYKCNICGNRFSTRGNLKVHFQRHKEKYPNVLMNPYPVPEHLDNVPTSTGIPFGMSVPPEKPALNWLDSKPVAGNSMLPLSLPSLPLIIKKEEEGISITKPRSPVVSEGCRRINGHQEVFGCSPPVISSGNLRSSSGAINTTELKSEHLDAKFLLGSLTNPLGASETSKLEKLVENIDKKSTDPNECGICHRVLSCQSALKMHFRTHTGERPFKCRVCGRAFTTKGNLKTHYSIHRSIPPLRIQNSCPICQEKFTNAMVLQQHIHMHMGGHIPNVPMLNRSAEPMDQDLVESGNLEADAFPNENTDWKHPGSLPDSLCSSPASSVIGRSNGSDTNTNKLTIGDGSVDGDCFSQRSSSLNRDFESLRRRISSDTVPSPKGSAYATQEYAIDKPPTESRLLDGSSGDSKDSFSMIYPYIDRGCLKSNVCDICNKTFACQSALDIHYRSHTKERPFICTTCNRGFSTKGNLKQHMLTHQMRELPSQLFEPTNQILILPPNHFLNNPSRRIEQNGLAKSDSPSGMVNSAAVLSTPALRRTAKQHFCQTCGKTFSSSSALQIHERTHTGEKPFACNICGRAFTTKGNLKVHMGTHMWSSSPARRGRRLSVDGPYLSSNSERFQDTSIKDIVGKVCNGDSVGLWSQRNSLVSGLGMRTNKIPVIQNGAIPHLSISAGHLENLEKLQLNRALPWLERLSENGTMVHFRQLVEDSKTTARN